MKLNIKTEKKYIWLLGYCLIAASIIEARTYSFLVTAGIAAGNEVSANPIVHYGGTFLLACFACLVLVEIYNLSPEEKRQEVMIIGVMAVSFVVLFCIINLWRLLACMY